MAKRLFTLLCASVLAFTVSMLVQASLAQEKMEKPDKMAKQGRWEGNVIRSDPNKSTLTVRKVGRMKGPSITTARLGGSARSTAAKRSTTLMPARSKMVIG